MTDGPFAETKEQLLGFILIEAKDHGRGRDGFRTTVATVRSFGAPVRS